MYSLKSNIPLWITQFKVLLWGTPSLTSGMCICFLSVSGGVCISWICFLSGGVCMCKLPCSAMVAQTSTTQARIQQLLCMTGRQGSNELVVHLLERPVEVVGSSRGKLHVIHLHAVASWLPLFNVPWSFPFHSHECDAVIFQKATLNKILQAPCLILLVTSEFDFKDQVTFLQLLVLVFSFSHPK